MWQPNEQLDYVGAIYRPPSEARSIILQATLGCSHDKCTFCPNYMGKKFGVKPREVVEADVKKAARLYPGVQRLFVADGDALVLPMKYWQWLLPSIREHLPDVNRIGVYATARSIRGKSDQELRWLVEQGIGIVYLGVESGDDETLGYVCKDSDSAQLIEAGRRMKAAGAKVSVTVLLGIAPRGRSLEHARETGRVLTEMAPDYVGALSVMLVDGTPMAAAAKRGEHPVATPEELLTELREMLAATDLPRGLFMSNHASNYLPLKVRMPKQKAEALELLDEAIAGRVELKGEAYRGL